MLRPQRACEEKYMSAEDALKAIKPGARIFIGTGCGQPQLLVDELVNASKRIKDAEIYHLLTQGAAPYINEEFTHNFRTSSFFVAPNVRQGIASGRGDYTPIFLSEIPRLFNQGKIPLDVALIQTSKPTKDGYLSLGIAVDIVKSAAQNSRQVIAEVNEKMPYTMGDSLIPITQIDALVSSTRDLLEFELPESDDTIEAIARNVAILISDGATVEVGIGTIPQAVLKYLHDKNDIGIHTEMFNDAIIPLVKSGIINGSRKSINKNKITASFCYGTRKLYDFIHENETFEFYPSEYVNDPFIISQHENMVAVNVALEIDMTGQVCSDSIGYDFYSGIGGQVDFNRGAARAKNGKAIIALPSTAKSGTISRIVPKLSEGAGVVTTRGDVHYVVTEFGIAYLFGKSIRERVLALADITHPDFRNEILREAKKRRYIYQDQKEMPPQTKQYNKEFETKVNLSDATEIWFRPIKPSDEKMLRDMCYACSEKSIAFRFFQQITCFPHKFIQEFTNIDYRKDMAIIALIQENSEQKIIAVGRYYLNENSNRAEVSFLVRDDWQSRGIGKRLLKALTDIAQIRKIKGFEAYVLTANQPMLSLFFNSGQTVSTRRESSVFHLQYDFSETC